MNGRADEIAAGKAPSLRLAEALHPSRNNLTLIRLLASLAVILGHAYLLSPFASRPDPLQRLLGFDSLGGLAVETFFFVSGLLVTRSFLNDPRPTAFMVKRAFRIFPALVVCILLTVLVAGPLLTDGSVVRYFESRETWLYLAVNSTLLTWVRWRLPGVFPCSIHGVNAALWTLPLELHCYYVVALLGGARWLRSRTSAALFCAGVILVSLLVPERMPWFGSNPPAHLLPACFATGVLACLYAEHIVIDWRVCAGAWLVAALAALAGWPAYPFVLACFATCLALATMPALLGRMRLTVDPSYGIYIYGFLIQQTLYKLAPTMGVHMNQALAVTLAVGVGLVSWRAIERPALDLGHRLSRRAEKRAVREANHPVHPHGTAEI